MHWVSMLVVQSWKIFTSLRVTFPSMSAGLGASGVGVVIGIVGGSVVVDMVGGGVVLS